MRTRKEEREYKEGEGGGFRGIKERVRGERGDEEEKETKQIHKEGKLVSIIQ